MTGVAVLEEALQRIASVVESVVDGVDSTTLTRRPTGDANTVAWLVWHLTRVQDDHVATIADDEQVWTAQGFADDFGLPFDDDATGYGQSPDEVAQVAGISADQLLRYHRAVRDATLSFLSGLDDAGLDRVVDDSYDPPVTLGARLVSVISDDLQHAGQAAYVTGLRDSG